MAAPNYTLATVTKNPDGSYTLGNRPADAYAGATVAAGGEKVPTPLANFDGVAAPAVGTPRDIYDVPTLKRKEVVDANVAAYPEADSAYYGCEFVDEVYGPGQPAYYKCMPSAPATTGGATAWKWFRLDIL